MRQISDETLKEIKDLLQEFRDDNDYEAGFCLAASAYKDGRELVSVIIGAKTTTARFTDAAAIFDIAYGLSQR